MLSPLPSKTSQVESIDWLHALKKYRKEKPILDFKEDKGALTMENSWDRESDFQSPRIEIGDAQKL